MNKKRIREYVESDVDESQAAFRVMQLVTGEAEVTADELKEYIVEQGESEIES